MVYIRIYLAGDAASQEWDDNVSTESSTLPPFKDPVFQVTRESRPNLKQVLQEEADFTDGRMGVTGWCCRP